MAFIMGGQPKTAAQPPPQPASSLRIQTSLQGAPLPIVAGRVRIAGNIIDYDDFTAVAHTTGGGGGGGGGKGGGDQSGCFAPDVIISGPDGGKPIGEIVPGDAVWCIDPDSGEKVRGEVQEVLVHDVSISHDKMLWIYHSHGALHVTENHYLWDDDFPDQKREAKCYGAGDILPHEVFGSSIVRRVECAPDIPTTYNLVILPHHNFFADGILAHNGGGGGSGKGSTSYTYTAALAFGIAEGPIKAIRALWNSKSLQTLASANFTAFLGTQGQTPWSYSTSNHPAKAITYSNLAYAGAGPFDFGSNANTPSLTWEVDGNISGAVTETYTVANPYTFTASYWALASAATEQWTIPPVGPYTVQAADPTAATAFPVVLGTINGASLAGSASSGVKYLTGGWLTMVGSSPAVGQYAVTSGGLYTFSAADAGKQVIIVNLALSPGVTDASGNIFTQVLGAPSSGSFSVTAQGVYTFAAADVGKVLTITDVPDADPSLVITDLLTNPRYGVGFPAALIGDLSGMQNYAFANGLFISLALNTASALNTTLGDISLGLNGEFVWSSGLLTWVSYGDQAASGYGKTYTPPAAPIYSLTDDDFQAPQGGSGNSQAGDPITCDRKRPADSYNDIKIEYLDRGNAYNPAIAEVQDDGGVTVFGLRVKDTKSLHFFCSEQSAMASAHLQMGREAVRNTYTFTLPWFYILLDPMDLISITDPGLGLLNQPCLVKEILENSDNTLTFTVEEYLAGTGIIPKFGSAATSGYALNVNVASGNVNAPVMFEPPYQLTGDLELWIAVSGGTLWGGCDVWVSTDGANYSRAGRVINPSRTGSLTATLPVGLTSDTMNSLQVSLSECSGQLISGSAADLAALNTLCWVDGELIAYQTATLTGPSAYTLTTLTRGCYGTPISSHSAGARFDRIDDAIFKYPYSTDKIGSTIYLKFQSHNIWGGGAQDISTLTPYTRTIQGPTPPSVSAWLAAVQNGAVVSFTWGAVTDVTLKGYDIAYGPQGIMSGRTVNQAWALMHILTEAARGTEMTNASVPPGSWTFGIRSKDIVGQLSTGITTIDLVVSSSMTQLQLTGSDYDPNWAGTLSNCIIHPVSRYLVPLGTKTCDQYGFEVFDQFCPDPTPTSSFTSGTVDLLATDSVRIWSTYVGVIEPSTTGNVALSMSINASTDNVTWSGWLAWGVGFKTCRYLQFRVIDDATSGACAISSFAPVAEASAKSDAGSALALSTGTAITFNVIYHAAPYVTATAGSGLTSVTATNVTNTGCILTGFVGSTPTTGPATWSAYGT